MKKIIILFIGIIGLLLMVSCDNKETTLKTDYTTYSAKEVKCQNFCENRDMNCVLIKAKGYGTLNDYDQFYCEDSEGERTMYPLYPDKDNEVYETKEYIVYG